MVERKQGGRPAADTTAPSDGSRSALKIERPREIPDNSDLALRRFAEELGRLAARALIERRRGYALPELALGLLTVQAIVRVLLWFACHR